MKAKRQPSSNKNPNKVGYVLKQESVKPLLRVAESYSFTQWPGIPNGVRIEVVSRDMLKLFPDNPESRTEETSPAIQRLVESYRQFGQISLILVNTRYEVIDGHRRETAVRLAGKDYVAVLVVDIDAALAFSITNATQKKHTSREKLGNYLADPMRVEEKQRAEFLRIEEHIERDGIKELHDLGGDAHTYRISRQIAAYCQVSGKVWLRRCIRWLLRWNQREIVRVGMRNRTLSAIGLFHAIKSNRRLCVKAGV